MASLDDQILHAQQAKKSRVIKVLVAILLSALLLALLLVLGKHFATKPPAAQSASVTESASVSESESAAQTVVMPEPPAALSNTFDSNARADLQQRLSETRQQLEQLAADPLLSRWQAERLGQLQQQIALAYQRYGEQDYAAAAALLPAILQQAQAYQQDFAQALAQAHSAASSAFAQGNLQQAKLHNTESLALNPDFVPALQLQQRLAVAEKVQPLWQQARVAELENNPAKEQALLEQILALDSAHQAAAARLSQLSNQQQQQAFANAIVAARAALEKQDYAAARQALSRAQRLAANRPELRALQQQLAQAEQAEAVSEALTQISVFTQADEWSTVQLLASKALGAAPDNVELQQHMQQAERIVAAEQQLSRFLQQPARLTDANIQQQAQSALADAQMLGSLSPKLATLSAQLRQLLASKQQPVAVRILSDNKTAIRVLGVGNVGAVTDKTIQLPPGDYQFEGACKGYRTELIQVTVPATSEPVQVRLQCQVRI